MLSVLLFYCNPGAGNHIYDLCINNNAGYGNSIIVCSPVFHLPKAHQRGLRKATRRARQALKTKQKQRLSVHKSSWQGRRYER